MKLTVFDGLSKLELLDQLSTLALQLEDSQILSKHWEYSSKYCKWFGHILYNEVVKGEIK